MMSAIVTAASNNTHFFSLFMRIFYIERYNCSPIPLLKRF